jgi:hypothetical protein
MMVVNRRVGENKYEVIHCTVDHLSIPPNKKCVRAQYMKSWQLSQGEDGKCYGIEFSMTNPNG